MRFIHHFSCLLSLSLAVTQSVHAEPLTQAARDERLAQMRDGLQASVQGLERRLAQPQPTPDTRDLTNGALAVLVLGGAPQEAEQWVRLAYAQQNMNPQSPQFGALPWQIGHPEIKDENANMFGTQALGPMWLVYGDRLSPAFKQEMVPHIQAICAAMLRRNFRTPSYTNIFLMRAVNMILLGEAISDKPIAEAGYAQFDQWLTYTRQHGIHEFDSPTYYGVDLDCLGLGYRYAARPAGHAKFKAALDYFWKDITANFFAPDGNLSGPHSRNYDFLRSAGGLEFYLYAEGLHDAQNTSKIDFEKTYLLTNLDAQGYHPDTHILALANLPERVILQKFDATPGADRYNYITPDFEMGSASANYGPQDKLLTVELASSQKLPVISVVPDIFDEPYGQLKTPDRSGHNKPTHLPLNPAAAQFKGAMLALLDLDPAKAPAFSHDPASLATNVLLPMQADAITLDGVPIIAATEGEHSAHLNSVIGVRAGQSAVAIRVFYADGCAGQEPVFTLKTDAAGLKAKTLRYAVYHYRGPAQQLKARHVHVGLLFMAAPCHNDDDFAQLMQAAKDARIEQSGGKNKWEVKAQVGDLTLAVGRDLEHHTLLYRRVNGQEMQTANLMINGQRRRISG